MDQRQQLACKRTRSSKAHCIRNKPNISPGDRKRESSVVSCSLLSKSAFTILLEGFSIKLITLYAVRICQQITMVKQTQQCLSLNLFLISFTRVHYLNNLSDYALGSQTKGTMAFCLCVFYILFKCPPAATFVCVHPPFLSKFWIHKKSDFSILFFLVLFFLWHVSFTYEGTFA